MRFVATFMRKEEVWIEAASIEAAEKAVKADLAKAPAGSITLLSIYEGPSLFQVPVAAPAPKTEEVA